MCLATSFCPLDTGCPCRRKRDEIHNMCKLYEKQTGISLNVHVSFTWLSKNWNVHTVVPNTASNSYGPKDRCGGQDDLARLRVTVGLRSVKTENLSKDRGSTGQEPLKKKRSPGLECGTYYNLSYVHR